MNDNTAAALRTPFPACLFSMTGRIGPAWYVIGLAVAGAALFVAVLCLVSASRPTGSGDGALLIGFPLLALAVWIVIAVTVQRLRDAGKPPALAILFIVGSPLVMGGMAANESALGLLVPILLGLIVTPAVLKRKPGDEALTADSS